MNAPSRILPASITAEIAACRETARLMLAHADKLERAGRHDLATLQTRLDMSKSAMRVWDDGEIAADIENCAAELRPGDLEDDGWKDLLPETGAMHPFSPARSTYGMGERNV